MGSHGAFEWREKTESLYSLESCSISTVLCLQDCQIYDAYGQILINPIPSPPFPAGDSDEMSHPLQLRQAVSFAAFLELSDDELCHAGTSSWSLTSLGGDESVVRNPQPRKVGWTLKSHLSKTCKVVRAYRKVARFVDRLIERPPQRKSCVTWDPQVDRFRSFVKELLKRKPHTHSDHSPRPAHTCALQPRCTLENRYYIIH